MLKTRTRAPIARRSLAATLVVAFALAGCAGAAAGPTPSPTQVNPSPAPTPTAVPGQDGSGRPGGSGGTGGGTDPGTGGGTGGNIGTGILPPGITFPLPQDPADDLLGQAKYLKPVADLINQRDVNVQLVRAAISDDGKAFADLRWYSGVEPCNGLDSVKLVKDDAAKTVRLTVVEGSATGDQMCIEIAELHAVAVDLGVLAAGTWTISADGDASPIKLDAP
jgi:hypothetical protein